MKPLLASSVTLILMLVLNGCAQVPLQDDSAGRGTAEVSAAPTQPFRLAQPVRVTGVGYGAMSSYEGHPAGEQRLLAMRAARLDAHQALAAQLHGMYVDHGSRYSGTLLHDDTRHAKTGGFIRGARLVSMTPLPEGNYEAVVELTVDDAVLDCVSDSRSCLQPPPTAEREPAACSGACGRHSASFYFER